MSDSVVGGEHGGAGGAAVVLIEAAVERIDAVVARAYAELAALDVEGGSDDGERAASVAAGAGEIEVIGACDAISRIVEGIALDAVSALDARRAAAEAGPDNVVRQRRRERSLAAEIGLARQRGTGAGEHAHRVALVLRDLRLIHALLRDGHISLAVASAVAGEAACLDPALRRRLDELLAPSLPEASVREAAAAARRIAISLDPDGAGLRAEKARAGRRVRFRRERDTMATLTLHAPAEQLVGAWRKLSTDVCAIQRAAQAAGAADPRTQRQLMADLAVEALTTHPPVTTNHTAHPDHGAHSPRGDQPAQGEHGATMSGNDQHHPDHTDHPDHADHGAHPDHADHGAHPDHADHGAHGDHADHGACGDQPAQGERTGTGGPGVEVGLLMRPGTLFGTEDTPATLVGYGPIPAPLARALASRDQVWLRRLFTDDLGDLAHADPRRRRFPAEIADAIRSIDAHCLRPYCDNLTRELDHVERHTDGGTSTLDNIQGVCRTDNLSKEQPGWNVRAYRCDCNNTNCDGTNCNNTDYDGTNCNNTDRNNTDRDGTDRESTRPHEPTPPARHHRPRRPRKIVWKTPTGHRYTAHPPRSPLGYGPVLDVPRTFDPLEVLLAGMDIGNRESQTLDIGLPPTLIPHQTPLSESTLTGRHRPSTTSTCEHHLHTLITTRTTT